MKQIFAICTFEIQRVLKKPQSYILMFAMPLLFTLLFGSLLSGADTPIPTLAWIDQDQSLLSMKLQIHLEDNKLFKIKTTTMEKADTLWKDKKVSGVVIIPKDYQKQIENGEIPQVKFEHGPEFSTAVAIKQLINNEISQTNIEMTAALYGSKLAKTDDWQMFYQLIDQKAAKTGGDIHVNAISKNQNQLKMSNTSARSAGFSIMFVMIVMMSVTGTLLEAKRSGIWYRLMATPASRFQVMSGFFLSFFLIGWIQFGILMMASSVMFDVHWGSLSGIIVLVSAVLLAMVGLGMFIASFVKTVEQQAAIGNIIVASTCMLGGVYWPLEIVPKSMQEIANFIPQKWAMDGFTELIARGGSIGDILTPVLILLAFAILFLGVGLTRIRYE